MRTLDVEFIAPPAPPRWAWITVALLLLSGLGLCVAALVARQAALQLEHELAELKLRAEQQRTPPLPSVPLPELYEASALQVLREATSPWPQWLTALETVKVDGVQIVGVEIDASIGRGRVEVQFTDMPALLQYLDDLNAGELRPRWTLDQAKVSESRNSGASMATLSIAANLEK